MRRLIKQSLFIVVLTAALLACAATVTDKNIIRFAITSAPVTLDPRYATDANSVRINHLLYQQLVTFNERYEPVPELAEWQQISALHYRFVLQDREILFHNGDPLTTADIVATYRSILAPGSASPHRASLLNIDKMVTTDQHTIDFHLKNADPLFPAKMTIGILPAKLITQQHPFQNRPVGSGGFRFDSWDSDNKLVIKRIDDGVYVEFISIKKPTVRALKLIRGEVDMIQNDMPQEVVQYLSQQDELNVSRKKGSNYTYIGFNLNDAVVGKQDIRRAISYAINRQDIIKYLLGGAAQTANSLLPPYHWAGNPDLTAYTYAPDRARQLLKKHGYDAKNPLHISYKTSSDPFRIRIATVIQKQLADVGIKVKIQSYDWGTFYGDIKNGRFQMYSLTWVGIKTPDIFRYVFHSAATPPDGANRGHYRNPIVDQHIADAEQASREKMVMHYQQLQQIIHQQLPYVPLWYEDNIVISHKSIQGYQLASDGNYDGLNTTMKM